MLRNNVAQGVVPGAIGREEEYIKERLELHRHPSGPLVRQWTDGTWRLIREIRTPDGGLTVSQTDITELKTIENTVRQSDSQFRALLDNVPAQITLRDKDGRYLVANKVLEERHELKVDDIIGEKNLHGSAHGNDSDFIEKWDQIIDKHFHQVIETGEVSTETRRVVLFDGSEIDSLVTKFPVFDETEDLIQVGSISVDVTERIKAEQALRQSEENFRALIDNMPASLTLRDQQGRYIAVNRVYEEQHNLKADDLVGQSREEVFDRSIEEVSSAEQQVQDVFKTEQAITLPRHKVNSDGSTSDYEVIKYPIFDDSGKVVQIGGIGIDVTERTNAEEALRQSEARFQGAIKSLQEGFALFDADDRLITFNDEYVRLHEGIRDIIKPGVSFAEICRANVMRGINLTAQGWEEDYIKQRLEERKNPANEPITLQMANGLWFMFRESRTPEGGLVSTYTNVSELKNIENELLVNQERLDAALEGVNEILWDWQLQDGDFYIDPRLEQHLGYPLGSLQPHINTWNDIVHPDDLGHYQTTMNQYITSRTSHYHDEYRILTKSGDAFWVHSRGAVMARDADSSPVRIAGTLTDITDRKRAEEALQETEERFQNVFDSASQGIVIHRRRIPLYANQAFAEMYGYDSADEILALGSTEILLSPANTGPRYHDDRLKGNVVPAVGERIGRRKNGEDFVYNRRSFVINWDGELAICSIREDISEQRRAEDALQESEERFKTLFDESNQGILVHRHHKPLYANQALADIYGYDSIEDILALESTRVLVHPDYKVNQHESRLRGEPVPNDREFLGVKKDGSAVWMNNRAFLIDWDGEPAVCTTRVDISEQKAAADELRLAKQEADQASAAKSEFLSSMSHELRTPMNAILGFSQLLEQSSKEPLSETQQKYVGQILKSGGHLLELIKGVLELSKIEAGKTELNIEDIDPRDIVDECVTLTQVLANDSSITFNDNTKGKKLPLLRCDRTRLLQIFLNLSSNAVKYNKPNGTVTFDYEQTPNGFARFSVTDTGIGIPKDQQELLFEPFARIETDKNVVEGTGIGLTITKSLVQLMGGQIGFESQHTEGSTFWVDIPLSSGRQANKSKLLEPTEAVSASHLATNQRRSILYIEDNPVNLKLMEDVLSHQAGTTMYAAHTAELGLTLAGQHQPDLIFMDINLPGMNGFEALAALRQDNKTKNIPVFALSADTMPHDIERGLKAGFNGYLTKPIIIGEILGTIDAALKTAE